MSFIGNGPITVFTFVIIVSSSVSSTAPPTGMPAAENGRDTADEVAFLMAHGILHLMEYNHEAPGERARMEAEHRRLLGAMLGPRASDIKVEYPA